MAKIKLTSVKSILNASYNDINELSKDDLLKVTRTLAYNLNRRVKKIEQSNIRIKNLAGSFSRSTYKGKFNRASVKQTKLVKGVKKDVSISDLRQSFNQFKQATEKKTTSLQKLKSIEKSQSFVRKEWSSSTRSKFWKAYRQAEENTGLKYSVPSKELVSITSEYFAKSDKRKGLDKFTQDFEKIMVDKYESMSSLSKSLFPLGGSDDDNKE